jgi:hypothetical protein
MTNLNYTEFYTEAQKFGFNPTNFTKSEMEFAYLVCYKGMSLPIEEALKLTAETK